MEDRMISEMLAQMGTVEGVADGLESRLDLLLKNLDGMLEGLGELDEADEPVVESEGEVVDEKNKEKV